MGIEIIWLCVGTVSFLVLVSCITQLRSDITHIKLTLDKIAKHIGVADTVTENIDEEIINLILQGKKIMAIKRYRMNSGLGLKESKDYIDLLSAKIETNKVLNKFPEE